MENRMNFQTSVELPGGLPSVSHADHILLMGSCFAENIGALLMDAKFRLDLNPFGILYNPLSILSALREIATKKKYTEEDLFVYRGLWHSPMHHGSFPHLLRKIHYRISTAACSKPTGLCRNLIG